MEFLKKVDKGGAALGSSKTLGFGLPGLFMRTVGYKKEAEKICYHLIIVGAGGTGGNLLTQLGRFLKFYKKENAEWNLTIIDGDHVEEKNENRQPFSDFDVMQNKAAVMKEGLEECFGLDSSRIKAHADYISSVEELHKICDTLFGEKCNEMVILLGCVDNHRARQIMHQFFYDRENVYYIDSANEFSNGEIVCGLRLAGMDIAPPRGYYYEDVLTDRSPSAKETSCGAVNISRPQHIATNLLAAVHCLSFIVKIMQGQYPDIGILYFDVFKHYSRFEAWNSKEKVPGKEEVLV